MYFYRQKGAAYGRLQCSYKNYDRRWHGRAGPAAAPGLSGDGQVHGRERQNELCHRPAAAQRRRVQDLLRRAGRPGHRHRHQRRGADSGVPTRCGGGLRRRLRHRRGQGNRVLRRPGAGHAGLQVHRHPHHQRHRLGGEPLCGDHRPGEGGQISLGGGQPAALP